MIVSSGVVLLTISLMALGDLEMWNMIPVLVPLFVGMAGIFAVGIAVVDEEFDLALYMLLGYPGLGMLMVLGYFSAPTLNDFGATVLAGAGIVAIVKGAMSVASGHARA
jgi:hypothetical protein